MLTIEEFNKRAERYAPALSLIPLLQDGCTQQVMAFAAIADKRGFPLEVSEGLLLLNQLRDRYADRPIGYGILTEHERDDSLYMTLFLYEGLDTPQTASMLRSRFVEWFRAYEPAQERVPVPFNGAAGTSRPSIGRHASAYKAFHLMAENYREMYPAAWTHAKAQLLSR